MFYKQVTLVKFFFLRDPLPKIFLYVHVKRKEILPFTMIGTELAGILLSETRQTDQGQ